MGVSDVLPILAGGRFGRNRQTTCWPRSSWPRDVSACRVWVPRPPLSIQPRLNNSSAPLTEASAARGVPGHLGGAIERQGDDMPTRRRLKGRTIAALAADGFEKVELIVPLRALKRPVPRSTSCPCGADGSAG